MTSSRFLEIVLMMLMVGLSLIVLVLIMMSPSFLLNVDSVYMAF